MRYKRYKYIYSKLRLKNKCKWFTNRRYSELKLKDILFTKFFNFPNLNNISINIDSRLYDIKLNKNQKEFNEFIKIRLPYFYKKNVRKFAISINLPIKWHKHSLKYKNWKRNNTIQLKMINNNYYIIFSYEKENIILVNKQKIGIDIGYKKLITTSDNQIIGKELKTLYEKIYRKKQGGINYKKSLKERDNLIGYYCNQINLDNINEIFIEDLKNVKFKTKQNKKIK